MIINLTDGEAADFGSGCFLLMQIDEYGMAHSVFVTPEDRAAMDASDAAQAG